MTHSSYLVKEVEEKNVDLVIFSLIYLTAHTDVNRCPLTLTSYITPEKCNFCCNAIITISLYDDHIILY